jgi:hypothetical protein
MKKRHKQFRIQEHTSSHLGVRISARTATLMLDMISSMVATVASGVGVLSTETETGGTLSHLTKRTIKPILSSDRLTTKASKFFRGTFLYNTRP